MNPLLTLNGLLPTEARWDSTWDGAHYLSLLLWPWHERTKPPLVHHLSFHFASVSFVSPSTTPLMLFPSSYPPLGIHYTILVNRDQMKPNARCGRVYNRGGRNLCKHLVQFPAVNRCINVSAGVTGGVTEPSRVANSNVTGDDFTLSEQSS